MASFSGDTITTALRNASKSWKVYAESLPQSGYLGGDQYLYIRHHSPFSYFKDVQTDSRRVDEVVPFSQLASDVANDYFFVIPNNLHNGHDCPSGGSACPLADRVGAMDNWMQANLNGLIITFDESADDNSLGGGRIATVVVGERVKKGFQSGVTYQFPSLLRFCLHSLGVSSFLGAAANAPDMGEFVQ